jgi:hypothetical protein
MIVRKGERENRELERLQEQKIKKKEREREIE